MTVERCPSCDEILRLRALLEKEQLAHADTQKQLQRESLMRTEEWREAHVLSRIATYRSRWTTALQAVLKILVDNRSGDKATIGAAICKINEALGL